MTIAKDPNATSYAQPLLEDRLKAPGEMDPCQEPEEKGLVQALARLAAPVWGVLEAKELRTHPVQTDPSPSPRDGRASWQAVASQSVVKAWDASARTADIGKLSPGTCRWSSSMSDVSGRIINAATLTRVSTGPCVFDSALEMATFMLLGTCTL
ncbi:hypothetical protein VCV18_007373 [Metarhizium anisopliae]